MISNFLTDCYKGGKGGSSIQYVPTPAPTPVVDEASGVELGEDVSSKKRTSKASLNVPLAKDVDSGLKV